MILLYLYLTGVVITAIICAVRGIKEANNQRNLDDYAIHLLGWIGAGSLCGSWAWPAVVIVGPLYWNWTRIEAKRRIANADKPYRRAYDY